jgi:YHS domain-containing protein
MTQDPVCDMTVDEEDAPRSEYDERTFYFCSLSCKRDFDAEPARYADRVEEPSTR